MIRSKGSFEGHIFSDRSPFSSEASALLFPLLLPTLSEERKRRNKENGREEERDMVRSGRGREGREEEEEGADGRMD